MDASRNYQKITSHNRHVTYITGSYGLISIQNPVCSFDNIKYQFRLEFDYNGVIYNLPITDYKFLKSRVQKEDEPIVLNDQIYACISIGIAHKEWHYKLVAGMIYEF